MSFEETGKGFINQYYQVFCGDRRQLGGVYRDSSLMTWSGEQLQGIQGIMTKMTTMTFTTAQFKPEDVDCHPSLSGGIIVVVNGECHLDSEAHPLKFNDVFHLAQDQGGWYISNQLFRIVGGSGA
eukprot:GILI01014621.1.p1 GENE.GILI01014621.1~~GILI01014621.1.p1  ORF type:complete len:125 (+),score=32.09 GILI01014621.1:75-449(+)